MLLGSWWCTFVGESELMGHQQCALTFWVGPLRGQAFGGDCASIKPKKDVHSFQFGS